MQLRSFRLRFKRRVRKSQRQVEGLGQSAEAGLERNFFRRLSNLGAVWRFITAWILLLLILMAGLIVQLQALSSHYQTLQPVAGGTYTEGILGSFTNANPLYATSEVDTAVTHLVFASLFTYNDQNQLVGDLATNYEVDAKGTTYTVHLKPHLSWQDGKPLTADDVVFTYHAIQNPDAQSPLLGSWQGINVTKKDTSTISFVLPTPLSSFPYTMTNGIVPQHILSKLAAAELRSANFNTVNPVGSGPFMWGALQVESSASNTSRVLIALKPFAQYQGGMPKISSFVVSTFTDKDSLVTALKSRQVNGIVGMDSLPAAVAKDSAVQQYDLLLSAATMAFFNTTNPVLSDAKVRQALVQATDTTAIIKQLGYPTRAVREPLLEGQLGYDPAYAQAPYNPTQAATTLTQAGWAPGADGIRVKAGKPLAFSLYADDSSEKQIVTRLLQHYWQAVGAKVDVRLESDIDLQTSINAHTYGALLHGISIGVDPDVFVYWDSSQMDPRSTRLNFSLYKSATVDNALEAGRTRLDPSLRAVKYKPFLQAWQQDAPALGLYQPRYLYATNEKIYGLNARILNTGADRFNNVQNWMVRTAKVTNQ